MNPRVWFPVSQRIHFRPPWLWALALGIVPAIVLILALGVGPAWAEQAVPQAIPESKPQDATPPETKPPESKPEAIPQGFTAESAVAQALENNPGLAARMSQARAAAEIPAQVGAWPDPMVRLGDVNVPTEGDPNGDPMTMKEIMVEQRIPFPGKTAYRSGAARAEAGAAMEMARDARLRLIRDVKVSWWRLFQLERGLENVHRNQELLRQLVQVASTKYKVGKGLQQDVLMAQLELSRMLETELTLKNQWEREKINFRRLLSLEDSDPVALAPLQDPKIPPLTPQQEQALADALPGGGERPGLAARRLELQAAEDRETLAALEWLPDLTVGLAYAKRPGPMSGMPQPPVRSVYVGVNLPLYGWKQSAKASMRGEERLMREQGLESERDQGEAEGRMALADYRRAVQVVELFSAGILPQAQQMVASMHGAYQVNKVDFLNLMRAQVTQYNNENEYWKAVGEAHQALARLAYAIGKESL
ncbi:MAG: TolC family protein [Deltaproteobacteria bacterium]|nr:TolC family protein [Deltaproteobacteria bacterium]